MSVMALKEISFYKDILHCIFLSSVSILLLSSCTSTKKASATTSSSAASSLQTYGSSFEKAILINETTDWNGVDTEYVWLRQNYAGYKLIK